MRVNKDGVPVRWTLVVMKSGEWRWFPKEELGHVDPAIGVKWKSHTGESGIIPTEKVRLVVTIDTSNNDDQYVEYEPAWPTSEVPPQQAVEIAKRIVSCRA